jgi:cobalt-zinc-cadmium efflux system outer membrane protein
VSVESPTLLSGTKVAIVRCVHEREPLPAPRRLAALIALIWITTASHTLAEAPSAGRVFHLQDASDLSALERLLLRSAPALASARGDVAVSEAELRQSRLWDNPSVLASWSTIPVGTTNPPDLERPFAQVPNYAVQVSYPFLIGKREQRVRSASASARAAHSGLSARTRALALEVAAVVGGIAANMLREQGLSRLADDAHADLQAGRARLATKLGTALEVDRLVLEVQRTEQDLLTARVLRERGLRACTALTGLLCVSFADVAAARSFLERSFDWAPARDRSLSRRHDLRALDALERASLEEAALARASRRPDPTLLLGYTHDRFLVSGSHRNSLNLGVSMPLPLVDHGQAREAAARARARALRAERMLRRKASLAALEQLQHELEAQRARQRQLSHTLVPNATRVVEQLEHAVRERLAPLTDLIQARRTLDELLLEESDSYAAAFDTLLALSAQTGADP